MPDLLGHKRCLYTGYFKSLCLNRYKVKHLNSCECGWVSPDSETCSSKNCAVSRPRGARTLTRSEECPTNEHRRADRTYSTVGTRFVAVSEWISPWCFYWAAACSRTSILYVARCAGETSKYACAAGVCQQQWIFSRASIKSQSIDKVQASGKGAAKGQV